MQEVVKKNERLEGKSKHIGGPLVEKIQSIEDLQFDDEGRPQKFVNY